MVNTYYYNGNEYKKRTHLELEKGFLLGSLASGVILGTLPLCGKPFTKQLKASQVDNPQYKDAFEKSLKISGLEEKGVSIRPAQYLFGNSAEKQGQNAFYNLQTKQITINTDKISIAGFHEAGHALNHLKGKFGKVLNKLRHPGVVAATLLTYVATFARTKPKEAPKSKGDWIKDNCGKLAFACMLPTVFEEGVASYKGIKLARQSGLAEPLIKNMKKLYGKALLTYIGHAVLTGLAVGATSMIMDAYSRPKKIEKNP